MRHRQSIAKIEVVQDGGRIISRGTGALVTDRLVLTALHVVADRTKDPPSFLHGSVRLTFGSGEVTAKPLDGRWDPLDDWVLLECERPPGPARIPLGEMRADEHAVSWETFGFPDAKPDGIRIVGEVRDVEAVYHGRGALQLYSDEAAAGHGAPVKGLSGAPCLADGAIVGVVRSSLLTVDATNVAGTLFACPIGVVLEATGTLLPRADPLRGLPGLPVADLPNQPFRYLDSYSASDAEIFFGRSAEIREVLERLNASDGDPVLLLYGQSGVGKSSLLHAGVAPRLAGTHEVRVRPRSTTGRLRSALESAVERDWLALEQSLGRPVVVVLDQVEEAYTQPDRDPDAEMDELCTELTRLLGDPRRRPRGRLVLSMRKEWLPEVEERLSSARVAFSKMFIQRLDRAGVIEGVLGITRSQRLRRKYGIEVEDGLAATIADELLADPGSAVAPVLQILMTRLHERAVAEAPGAPKLTRALYLTLKREGLHLADFLARQLAAIGAPLERHVGSGLVDDLLEAHTTALATADTRTRAELDARYPHVRTDLGQVLLRLAELYVLTSPATGDGAARTRLAHDTLAPVVRKRYAESARAGQRARRLLEARAGARTDDSAPPPLGAADLAIVEGGLDGMRAISAPERALIASSRGARTRARVLTAAMAVGVLLASGVALWRSSERQQARERSATLEHAATLARARDALDSAGAARDARDALLHACRAVEIAADDDPLAPLYVARAIQAFVQVPPHAGLLSAVPLVGADLSADLRRAVIQRIDGRVLVVPAVATGPERAPEVPIDVDSAALKYRPRMSRDGRWVMTVESLANAAGHEQLTIWAAHDGTRVLQDRFPAITSMAFFTADSRHVVFSIEGALHAAAVREDSWRSIPWAWPPGQYWGLHALHQWRAEGHRPRTLLIEQREERRASVQVRELAGLKPAFTGPPLVFRAAEDEKGAPPPRSLTGGPIERFGFALSADSSKLAALVRDSGGTTIEVREAATGRELSRTRMGAHEYFSIGLPPGIVDVDDDGQRVLLARQSSPDRTLAFPDVAVVTLTDPPVLRRTDLKCSGVGSEADLRAVVPQFLHAPNLFDGAPAVVCSDQEQLAVWTDGSSRAFAPVDVRGALAFRMSADGQRAAVVYPSGRMDRVPLVRPAEVHDLGPVDSAIFSADARRLVTSAATASSKQRRLAIHDAPTWKESWHAMAPVGARGLAATRGADQVAAWGGDGEGVAVHAFDTAGAAREPVRGLIVAVGFDPTDGSMVVVDSEVDATPTATGCVVGARLTAKRFPRGVAAGSDVGEFESVRDPVEGVEPVYGFAGGASHLLYRPGTACEARTVEHGRKLPMQLQDSRTGEVLPRLEASSEASSELARILLTTSGTLEVANGAARDVRLTVSHGGSPIASVVSASGITTVSGPSGEPYRVAARRALPPGAFCAGGPYFAYRVDPADDGDRPQGSAALRPIRVEALAAGVELARFYVPPPLAMAFTPDCERLLTIATDGVVRESFVAHRHQRKAAWVAKLGALATGLRLDEQGASVAAMGTEGERDAYLLELRAAAKDDPGARYVLQYIEAANP